MKHHMDSRFTVVRKDTFLNLLAYMLGTFEDLYAEIAPNGFEHSPYHDLYSTTFEHEYREYRKRRALEYRTHRFRSRLTRQKPAVVMEHRFAYPGEKVYTVPDLLTFQQFCETHQISNPQPKMAGYALYIECLKSIFDHRVLVYDDRFRCYTNYNMEPDEYMRAATLRACPEYEVIFDSNKFHGKRYYYSKPDLTPIYVYIYELLKVRKLDCMYTVLNEKTFNDMMQYIEGRVADMEADRILITDYGDRSVSEVEAERQERMQLKTMEHKKIENPVVEAYHQVYGKLMENYRYDWQ